MHNTQNNVIDQIKNQLVPGDRDTIATYSKMSRSTVDSVLAGKFNNDKVIDACKKLLEQRVSTLKDILCSL